MTDKNGIWLSILSLQLCLISLGCSSLGFSTYPVAHFMTNQTKEVLESSPRRPAVARELAEEVMPIHYLQPGDELLVEAISGDSEIRLPADQQVFADGTLDLAKYGRVKVASLTLEDAERVIYDRLAEFEKVDVSVNVRMIQPVHRFYVIGEVNSPGAYPLTGYETVLDGLMAAGGLTPRASACDALLARPTEPYSCRVTLPVCYRAITQLGDTTTNYQLKPGDRIFVGRQTFCEEFLPCCSQRTCERCCGCQQACRNPRIAERNSPNFVSIDSGMIVSPPMPPQPEADHDANQPEIPNSSLPAVTVEPWSAANQDEGEPQSVDRPRSAEPERSETADPGGEDGQLDFDSPQPQ